MNRHIQENFSLLLFIGIVLGYLFPGTFVFIYPWVIPVLCVVMIMSFLSMDFSALKMELKSPTAVILPIVVSKILIPGILFLLIRPFHPILAVAVLLVGATPYATVTPALSRLCGGNGEFSLVLLVLTTMASPFLVPATMKLFAGTTVEMDLPGMIRTLLQLILGPFILAYVLKRYQNRRVEKVKPLFRINLGYFDRVYSHGASGQGGAGDQVRPQKGSPAAGLRHGSRNPAGGSRRDSSSSPWEKDGGLALSVGFIYINAGLAIVMADKFFTTEVMLFAILYEVPANVLPGVVQKLTRGPKRPDKERA